MAGKFTDKTRNALYGRKWREARRAYLTLHPLCVYCRKEGRINPATELDHIVRHKGDPELFWDVDNWQGLCSEHHRSAKASEERGGKQAAMCDARGYPVMPNKYWQ